jgi:tetratricopeptide (TPR) repeat protein
MELTLAIAADPAWRLPRRKLAELNAAWGVRLFRGIDSGAISRWERALKLDEDMKNVRYYLTHSYYLLDDRDQSRALSYGLQLVQLAPERGLLADVYQRLGDIYFKERRDAEARTMYRLSLVMIPLVKQLSLQAQRGLIGL